MIVAGETSSFRTKTSSNGLCFQSQSNVALVRFSSLFRRRKRTNRTKATVDCDSPTTVAGCRRRIAFKNRKIFELGRNKVDLQRRFANGSPSQIEKKIDYRRRITFVSKKSLKITLNSLSIQELESPSKTKAKIELRQNRCLSSKRRRMSTGFLSV